MHYILIVLVAFLFTGCSDHENNTTYMTYDIKSPSKIVLPADLLEVSGICMKNEQDFYAVQDEKGILYTINQEGKITDKCKFSESGDYEDVVVANGNIIILRSDGALLSFPASQVSTQETEQVKLFKNLLPEEEYEGLAFDGKHLYVLCKKCGEEKKFTNGYVLQVSEDGEIVLTGNFKIDNEGIQSRADTKKKLRPSALAFKASTEEWFIVSSKNKVLVITDNKWKVKEVFQLDPDIFIQPEGIVFDHSGNLYISNEGDKNNSGNILKFPELAPL